MLFFDIDKLPVSPSRFFIPISSVRESGNKLMVAPYTQARSEKTGNDVEVSRNAAGSWAYYKGKWEFIVLADEPDVSPRRQMFY